MSSDDGHRHMFHRFGTDIDDFLGALRGKVEAKFVEWFVGSGLQYMPCHQGSDVGCSELGKQPIVPSVRVSTADFH